ncbi:cytochrome P450 81F2-like, partial [Phalaenopsis equestris]|uniref:cytochrome P450 81F2-like n=1 Tax=Phalaenopsis equestris TaxID=78828 RepID=UPI0009E24A54
FSDTSALTIEWALVLLLCIPTALSKTSAELDRHIITHRLINETHFPNIPYPAPSYYEKRLRESTYEKNDPMKRKVLNTAGGPVSAYSTRYQRGCPSSLRSSAHPRTRSNEDCTIEALHVKEGAMLLVNAWAINIDLSLWVE